MLLLLIANLCACRRVRVRIEPVVIRTSESKSKNKSTIMSTDIRHWVIGD
jgi:hypothetical protein